MRRQIGLVEEDATKVVLVRKHLVLVGQIGAAGIYEVDTGKVVLAGNVLGTQVLFHGHWVVGATLYRSVVRNDDALDTVDPTNTGDDACSGHIVVVVHAVCSELGKFQKG